jgi:hypothetical protein
MAACEQRIFPRYALRPDRPLNDIGAISSSAVAQEAFEGCALLGLSLRKRSDRVP